MIAFVYFIYGLAWTLIVPVLSLLSLTLVSKWRPGLKQKLGLLPEFPRKSPKRIWFHAVSVGELNALVPVLKCFSGGDIVLSTTTSTAQQMAATKLRDEIEAGLIKLIYMPWDHPMIIAGAIKKIQPYALITVETEVWPALIVEAKRAGVKVAVINARLNDASYKAYSRLAWFFKPIFAALDLVLAQSAADSRKFIELGTSTANIYMFGNIKFSALPLHGADEAKAIRKVLGYSAEAFILMGASTHEEEEGALINIFQELKPHFPQLRLILAPRHPARFHVVEQLILSAAQLQVVKFSQIKTVLASMKLNDVLVIDTIGDLASLTSIADLVFVGGTIPNNIGGHNVLEPAAYGIPVVVGVNYFKNVETVEMMEAEGALEVSQTIEELRLSIKSIIENDDKRVLMGARATNAMKKNQKILEDTVIKLNEFINPLAKV
jgi:3-deoxy-D-manno-octulosonic-acid transferase